MNVFIVTVRTPRESKRLKSIRVKEWAVVADSVEEAIEKVRKEDPAYQAAKHTATLMPSVNYIGSYQANIREGE